MIHHFRILLSCAVLFCLGMIALVAYAAPTTSPPIQYETKPKRKVTKFEYDSLGRVIKTQVFDDVGDDAKLVAETETKYDRYHNVTEERSKAVNYDGVAVTPYAEIIQRYAYEDSTWPTKVTKKYQPRYEFYGPSWVDRLAEQYYYDQETGQLELSLSSNYYCVDLNASYNAKPKAGVFSVEQSGQSFEIGIVPYTLCGVEAYEYDNLGRVAQHKQSLALNYVEFDNPEAQGRVWLETDYEYYSLSSVQKGALKSTSLRHHDPSQSRISHYDWDAVGNLISVTNPLGHETTADYDVLRRITGAVDPVGGETRYVYDAAGRLRAIAQKIKEGEWANSRAEYFANGQLKSVSDPDGDVTSYRYDAAGRLDVTTDGEGRQSKVLYYPNGQVKCTIKAYGTSLQQAYAAYDYGPDGQVKSQRPAKGSNPTTCRKTTSDYDTDFTYDGFRRLFQTTFPKRPEDAGQVNPRTGLAYTDSSGRTYSRQWHDPSGLVYQTRTRYGDVNREGYDASGNLYYRRTPENMYQFRSYGNGTQYWASIRPRDWSVDNTASTNDKYPYVGRRIYAIRPSGLGDIDFEQVREGFYERQSPHIPTTSYFYDKAGQRTAIKYWQGAVASYAYDPAGRMQSVSFKASSSAASQPVAYMSYDLSGRLDQHFLGDRHQTNSDGNPMYGLQGHVYDADGDLKQRTVQWSTPNLSVLTGLNYSYDYDASGKMTKQYASNHWWRYKETDNRTESYQSTNALDQYSSVDLGDGSGAQSYSYDGNGNLTSDSAGRSYTYNSENQLVRVTAPGVDMEYLYDALGRRSHSIDYIGGVETFHAHSGDMEVADYAVTREGGIGSYGAPRSKAVAYDPLTRNIIGAGVDQRLAFHEISGDELTFPLTNHQGSLVSMVDEDGYKLSGWQGGRMVYDPYGNEVSGTSEAGYPYRYTGRRYDAQTGLYYYRARYYDPRTGRFLQTDPIGTQDQMNLYAYVHNDPINNIDPNGEETLEVIVSKPKKIDGGHVAVRLTDNDGNQISRGFYPKANATAFERIDAARTFMGNDKLTLPGQVRDDKAFTALFDEVTGDASFGKSKKGAFESLSTEIDTDQYNAAIGAIGAFEEFIEDWDVEKGNGWGRPCHCGTFAQTIAGAAGVTIGDSNSTESVEPKNLYNELRDDRLSD